MKIAIVGSRTFEDYDTMCSFIDETLATMGRSTIEAVVYREEQEVQTRLPSVMHRSGACR